MSGIPPFALLCDFCCSTPTIISVRVQLGAWCMAKCAYCAEPLPDSDDEECDEDKEEDDGGCGEEGFCDDFCREMKEDDRRWDQETLGFSLSAGFTQPFIIQWSIK